MDDKSDPAAENRQCVDWKEIVECLEAFPAPLVSLDDEGIAFSREWVFRGLRSSSYDLNPRIERTSVDSSEWSALEVLVSSEFKARAHMHVPEHSIPHDELTWLALMQHWGVPTRLLDFSYSPFVALYFAIRGGEREGEGVRLWALDAGLVNARFESVARTAKIKEYEKRQEEEGIVPKRKTFNFGDEDMYSTIGDFMKFKRERLPMLVAEAAGATGTRRGEQQRSGCVCVASPPSFNPRLASQQGVFLVNCAETLTFRESLNRMMKGRTAWCKTFDIGADAIPEIEERLFQMNIHEQSLFPDMEGLAGLIQQRARLHWKWMSPL